MGASIDWPRCPTTTRSSILPCRGGPKTSSQGGGRKTSSLRKHAGTAAQEGSASFSTSPARMLFGFAGGSFALIEYLLSQPAAPCHASRLDRDCLESGMAQCTKSVY